MPLRSVEPAGSRRADLRRGLTSLTPTAAARLVGLRLTDNPSRSTVEPRSGVYLGDVGRLSFLGNWLFGGVPAEPSRGRPARVHGETARDALARD